MTTSGVPDPGRSGGEGRGPWLRDLLMRGQHLIHDGGDGIESWVSLPYLLDCADRADVTPVLVIPAASARDTIARALDDMNVSGWLVYPHPNTGEPMQGQVPLDYIAEGVLAALVREAGR